MGALLRSALTEVGRLLLTAFSTKDNTSGDLHKLMFAGGFAVLLGLDIYATLWLRVVFEMKDQAIAMGLYLGASAGSQLLKTKSETGG